MTRRASRIAAALAVLVFAVTLAAALLKSQPRYAGTNSVRAVNLVAGLAPHRPVCQKGELVPRDAASVEVAVATGGQPGPPLATELRQESGQVLARGRVDGGYTDGVVDVPIPVVRRTVEHVEVCVRATAPGPVQLYGQANAAGKLLVAGKPAPGVLRLGYKRPGNETWLALAPAIAHRFSQAKTSIATPVTFWVLVVLVLGVAGLAIRSVLSEDEEERALT